MADDARAREWAETQRRMAERKAQNAAKRAEQNRKNAEIVARLEGGSAPAAPLRPLPSGRPRKRPPRVVQGLPLPPSPHVAETSTMKIT